MSCSPEKIETLCKKVLGQLDPQDCSHNLGWPRLRVHARFGPSDGCHVNGEVFILS